ncbi:MAG: type VI secretion system ATPase TssH, partial [Chlamydiales bacterium]|nr:type VI secretion system ATPase TssH [Chlamydiales bacterium]
MAPQFTEAVATAIEEAFKIAQDFHHLEVNENHLLHALLLDPQGYFSSICQAISIDPKLLDKEIEHALTRLPTYSTDPKAPQVAAGLQQTIMEAEKIAKSWNDSYISSDHIFLAL